MSRYECDCGAIYSSLAAIESCQINNHGKGQPAPKVARSNTAAVRNPIAAIPEVAARAARLSPEARAELQGFLGDMSKDFRARGDHSWRKHKPPVAAYWKQNAVIARHLRLALRQVKP